MGMFASNALPPPSSFGHGHPPLHLTAEPARPQPQGSCHFQLLPSQQQQQQQQQQHQQQQRCLCQTYQQNRNTPGNICDCGHSACYHSQNNIETRLSPDRVVTALIEKVKKLEELVITEREVRTTLMTQERQAWEKETRILREALAPFYRSESEMRRKLHELEDRLENNHDEAIRLKERVVAIDNANMLLEQRLDICEASRCRKRKASLGQEGAGVMSPESNYTGSSSASDATSASLQRSPQLPSPVDAPIAIGQGLSSPRSSGVLHPKAQPRNIQREDTKVTHQAQHLWRPAEEARSSGFLSIDLAQRLRSRQNDAKERAVPAVNERYARTAHVTASGLPSPPHSKVSSRALPVSGLLSHDPVPNHVEPRFPKKLKHQNINMTGLELLANVATPLAQQG